MSAKLYVGNLPYSVNQDQLMDIFSQVGEVVEAVVISDRHSGRSKGFGFVTMASEEAAQTAIEQLDGKDADGRAMVVKIARPPKPRNDFRRD
jgi:RNA recognition motif-containing protein